MNTNASPAHATLTPPRPAADPPPWYRRELPGLALVLLAAALLIALRPGARLPLEKNEAYVARAAEEMLERGDLLVPYFNGEPRLRKPPLSYWLVIAADRLNGADGRITEAEARAPSALGYLLLVLSTWGIARLHFGRRTALVAALFVAGCAATADYVNSARPDMLYAGLCASGLSAWLAGGAADKSARRALWVLGGWCAMALAMLTKGPHLPLMLALGTAVGLWASGRARHIRPTLWPLLGPLVMLLLSGAWFVLVLRTRPESAGIWSSQMTAAARPGSPSLLPPMPDLTYPFGPVQLLLPWSIFYLLGLAYPWLGPRARRRRALLLWWTMVLPLLLLSFTHRYFYLLPILPIAATLAAAAALHFASRAALRGDNRLWKTVFAVHALVLVGAAIVLGRRHPSHPFLQLGSLGAIATLAYALWLLIPRRRGPSPGIALAALALIGVIFFSTHSRQALLWPSRRAEQKLFLQEVAQCLRPGDVLAGWRDRWPLATYYLHRNVLVLKKPDDLARLSSPAALWLLTQPGDGLSLPLPPNSHKRLASATAELWQLATSPPPPAVNSVLR